MLYSSVTARQIHFTLGEVIRLMVNLLFTEDGDVLSKPAVCFQFIEVKP
jgi:hypothetical protein